jgi:hypothetical protein
MKTIKLKELEAIPAKKFRQLRQRLDYAIDHTKEGADLFNDALAEVRKQAKNDLLEAGANTPYKQTMENYAKMLDARDRLYKVLGKRSDIRENRIQSFVGNLFGKYKAKPQEIIKNIDEVFGENFSRDIKLSSFANEMTREGKIPLLASQTTGRSMKGEALAATQGAYGLMSGNPLLFGTSATTLALSSPRVAPRLIGATRGLANVPDITQSIMTNPYLQRTIPGLARMQYRGE